MLTSSLEVLTNLLLPPPELLHLPDLTLVHLGHLDLIQALEVLLLLELPWEPRLDLPFQLQLRECILVGQWEEPLELMLRELLQFLEDHQWTEARQDFQEHRLDLEGTPVVVEHLRSQADQPLLCLHIQEDIQELLEHLDPTLEEDIILEDTNTSCKVKRIFCTRFTLRNTTRVEE